MTEMEKPQQRQKPSIPKSLAELKLPTQQEAESAVRMAEEMISQMARARRKKSGPFDVDLWVAPIGKVPSKSVAPVPAPVVK